MIPYIIFSLIIIAFWVYLHRYILKQNARTQAVRTLARELGFIFDEGGVFKQAKLQGSYQGIDLNIYEEIGPGSYSNKHRQLYTLYNVSLRHLDVPEEFLLYSESISTKLDKLFGGQDIQLNDPKFDKTFVIRGTSEDHVRAFLNRPNVKQYLLDLHDLDAVFRLENKVLTLEFRTSIINHHLTIYPLIQRLARCVNAMGPPAGQLAHASQVKASANTSIIPENTHDAPVNMHPPPDKTHPAPEHMTNIGDSW